MISDAQQAGPSLRELGQALGAGASAPSRGHHATSDLSLDEILLLHAIGLEPASVVYGVSCVSVAAGVWTWSTGQVQDARQAFHQAFRTAAESLRAQAHRAQGVGVVGVEIEVDYGSRWMSVFMTGTAVRSSERPAGGRRPFVTNLSARDAVVLEQAGWELLDLVVGASFVHAPRRGLGAALGQATQNVELTNFTETLYDARETAMGDLQQGIIGAGGTGLVDVKVSDGPMHFASHVVRFVAWGTAIRLSADTHRHLRPTTVLPMDDVVRTFEATSLE